MDRIIDGNPKLQRQANRNHGNRILIRGMTPAANKPPNNIDTTIIKILVKFL